MRNKTLLSSPGAPTVRTPFPGSRPLLTAAIAAWVFAGGSTASAGPEGGVVVGGQGTISQPDAATTLIQQSTNRMAIDWNTFNVSAGERVEFQQPSSNSLALNRILDQNPSQIFGAIDANGRVLLVNPNGMIFGRNASINVAGLVATSLDINPGAFMNAGAIALRAGDGTEGGLVANDGTITTTPGGFVVLAGGAVRNSGVIVADLGTVELAAGHAATLDFRGDGMILFQVDQAIAANLTAAQSAVENTGTLQANGGQILLTAAAVRDIFTSVVNNSGVIRANRIDNSGGIVQLVAAGGDTVHTGTIDASSGDGVSTGGSVQVLGDRVGLFGSASINASGATGGGHVLVGGDYQGANPDISNARQTVIGSDASIAADAGQAGDGGRVIVWADGQTRYAGSISARGGANGGNGGFVETSGKTGLVSTGSVNASASQGSAGNWLLDPADVTLNNNPTANGTFTSNTFSPDTTQAAATVNVADIVTSLQLGTNVTILTTNTGTPGAGNGDITVAAPVTANMTAGGATLTLRADRDIVVNSAITGTGANGLGVTLTAARNVDVNAAITTNGGAFNSTSSGGTFDNTGGIINAGAGNAIITHTGAVTLGANVSGADISATATGAALTVAANVALTATGNASLTGATLVFGNAASVEVDDNNNGQNTLTLSGIVTAGTNVNLTGNGTNDTLVGPNDANTWVVNDGLTNPGVLTTNISEVLNFEFFGTLTGGSSTDDFAVGAGGPAIAIGNLTVNGGGGNADTFTINQDTTVDSLTVDVETITINTYDLTSTVGDISLTAATIDLDDTDIQVDQNNSRVAKLTLAASTALTLGTTNTGVRLFGSSDDTLVGPNLAATWTIDAADFGNLTVNAGVTSASFSGFANLTGGTAADTFNVNDGGTLSGTLTGGTGSDTLSFANRTTGVAVAVTDATTGAGNVKTLAAANVVGSFAGLETVTGSGLTTDTLTGANVATTWTVDGANGGNLDSNGATAGSLAFTGIANLTGGTAADTFNVNDGGTLSGTLTGGTGSDTLSFANRTTGVAVETDLATSAGSNVKTRTTSTPAQTVVGGFVGIETLTGSTAGSSTVQCCTIADPLFGNTTGDKLTVTGNGDRTWDINATSKVGSLEFTNFEMVTAAGTGIDNVNLNGTPTAQGLFSFDAGDPTALPGDTLTVLQAGGFTFAGDLVWSNFEKVDLGSGMTSTGIPGAPVSGRTTRGDIWMYQVREVVSTNGSAIDLTTDDGITIFSAALLDPKFGMSLTTNDPLKVRGIAGTFGQPDQDIRTDQLAVVNINLGGSPTDRSPVPYNAATLEGATDSNARAAEAAAQRATGQRDSEIPEEEAYQGTSYEVTCNGVSLPPEEYAEGDPCAPVPVTEQTTREIDVQELSPSLASTMQ